MADYKRVGGKIFWKMLSGVNWLKGTFRQDKDRRCAFLNEKNLCCLYLEKGEEGFCKTCRTYPRHIEEFEGVREITLSISCPEAARTAMIKILQDRTLFILGMANDMQRCINQKEMFDCFNIIEKYAGEKAKDFIAEVLKKDETEIYGPDSGIRQW